MRGKLSLKSKNPTSHLRRHFCFRGQAPSSAECFLIVGGTCWAQAKLLANHPIIPQEHHCKFESGDVLEELMEILMRSGKLFLFISTTTRPPYLPDPKLVCPTYNSARHQ